MDPAYGTEAVTLRSTVIEIETYSRCVDAHEIHKYGYDSFLYEIYYMGKTCGNYPVHAVATGCNAGPLRADIGQSHGTAASNRAPRGLF